MRPGDTIDYDRSAVRELEAVWLKVLGSLGIGAARDQYGAFLACAVWRGTVEDAGWAISSRPDLLIVAGKREYARADARAMREVKVMSDASDRRRAKENVEIIAEFAPRQTHADIEGQSKWR